MVTLSPFASLRMTGEGGRGDRLGRPGQEVNAYGVFPEYSRTGKEKTL